MNRRKFLGLAVGTAACAVAPLRLPEKICCCGSGMKVLADNRCAECMSAKEMNYFLFMRGLRPTPYIAQSARDERMLQRIGAASCADDSAVNTTGFCSHSVCFCSRGFTNCQRMEANETLIDEPVHWYRCQAVGLRVCCL